MTSWWDRYFAPGDVRAQNQQKLASTITTTSSTNPRTFPPHRNQVPRLDAATRSRRQNGLLVGGAAFTILSLVVTRRAVQRKLSANYPRTFTASSPGSGSGLEAPGASRADGGLEAIEALGLASMNVFSFAMLTVGAAMTVFDVADVQDLRELMRRAVGEDVFAGESKADREIEGWVADVLSRRDGDGKGIRDGVKEGLAEIERLRGSTEKERER